MPYITESEARTAIDEPEKYLQLIPNIYKLHDAIKNFPLLASRLIETASQNLSVYQKLFEDLSDLERTAECSPDKEESLGKLSQPLLKNRAEYQRLIGDIDEQIYAMQLFPNYAKELLKPALEEPEEFQRLYSTITQIYTFTSLFEKYATTFTEHIINDLTEFKRLIKNNADLRIARQFFSDHPEISKHRTYELALKAVEARAEIQKNSKELYQIHRMFPAPIENPKKIELGMLPVEVLTQIAAATGNHEVHTRDEEDKIACESFDRPSCS